MDFKEVKEIIEIMKNSDLAYFELKNDKDYVKIDKSLSREYIKRNEDNYMNSLNNIQNNNNLSSDCNINIEESVTSKNETKEDDDFEYIKSPIVGSYYKAMSPTSDPFVSIGQKVNKGEVVCIVEAMKLMNEIVANFDCEIVDILCEDGKMVQYGQELLKVRRL